MFTLGQFTHQFAHRANLYRITTANGLHQLRGVFQGFNLTHEIHTTLKAMRRIGGEFITAGFALNKLRRKKRRFEENMFRVQLSFRVKTAHHARHTEYFFIIGNHQHIVLQHVGLLIE